MKNKNGFEEPQYVTKGDLYKKYMINRIFSEGSLDKNPRPHYSDGTPAHTFSVNHDMFTYNIANGESPFVTLRPIAVKSGIKEVLWIYQDQSNDLNLLRDKYNVKWWDEWDIGNRTIGACYGETVRRHHLMDNLLKDLKENPDGRRHIMNLWQEDDFKDPHGLKPCAFQTVWNVRYTEDKAYLDMCLFIRSSDFLMAADINQLQYLALQTLVAKSLDYEVGRFTFFMDNVQIYNRHMDAAEDIISRKPIPCYNAPHFEIPEKKDFYDYTIDDIKIVDYPLDEIKKNNPQIHLDIGI